MNRCGNKSSRSGDEASSAEALQEADPEGFKDLSQVDRPEGSVNKQR